MLFFTVIVFLVIVKGTFEEVTENNIVGSKDGDSVQFRVIDELASLTWKESAGKSLIMEVQNLSEDCKKVIFLQLGDIELSFDGKPIGGSTEMAVDTSQFPILRKYEYINLELESLSDDATMKFLMKTEECRESLMLQNTYTSAACSDTNSPCNCLPGEFQKNIYNENGCRESCSCEELTCDDKEVKRLEERFPKMGCDKSEGGTFTWREPITGEKETLDIFYMGEDLGRLTIHQVTGDITILHDGISIWDATSSSIDARKFGPKRFGEWETVEIMSNIDQDETAIVFSYRDVESDNAELTLSVSPSCKKFDFVGEWKQYTHDGHKDTYAVGSIILVSDNFALSTKGMLLDYDETNHVNITTFIKFGDKTTTYSTIWEDDNSDMVLVELADKIVDVLPAVLDDSVYTETDGDVDFTKVTYNANLNCDGNRKAKGKDGSMYQTKETATNKDSGYRAGDSGGAWMKNQFNSVVGVIVGEGLSHNDHLSHANQPSHSKSWIDSITRNKVQWS